MHKRVFQSDGLLFLAAVIWGAAFVAQRAAMEHVGPMVFNGVRFLLGAAALVPVIVWNDRRRRAAHAGDDARDGAGGALGDGARAAASSRLPSRWRGALIAGLALFIAASLQQIGIVYTTAGKAGFITGMYVVLVPVFGLLVGQRSRWTTWCGVGLAAAGLYFLSVSGELDVNKGDVYVMACAAVWAVQVLLIGWLSPGSDPLRLAFVQFVLTGVLSVVAVLAGAMSWIEPGLQESFSLAGLWAARWPILYGGVMSVGVAFTLQVIAQRDVPPAHAGILLSLEAVFAALTGWMILSEQMALREIGGCALMLAGVLVSQVPAMRGVRRAVPHQPVPVENRE